jgi:hypothetical protein
MFLGISFDVWVFFSMIGIVLALVITDWKSSKQSEKEINKMNERVEEEIEKLVKNAKEYNIMRWLKISVPPERVAKVLNKIEEMKIPVMYQFFLNTNTGIYDMFFRCNISQFNELSKALIDFE